MTPDELQQAVTMLQALDPENSCRHAAKVAGKGCCIYFHTGNILVWN